VRGYVGDRLGDGGVLIVDDTGFIKKGTTSAGVSRQYTGTTGKIDNCQIGVFAAYTTERGRALVDRELYLPKCWTSDSARLRAAKVPNGRVFATKGELARRIITRLQGDQLPAWIESATATTDLPSLCRFAQHLERDLDAVVAGLTQPWNSGVVEGHVNRIKMLKRQMFGGAGFELLRKRVLLA
jgi:hypothetical protein